MIICFSTFFAIGGRIFMKHLFSIPSSIIFSFVSRIEDLFRCDHNFKNKFQLSKLTPVQGFIQFEYFDGSACNGTKTYVTGVQTNHCTHHASSEGSYLIQIRDG